MHRRDTESAEIDFQSTCLDLASVRYAPATNGNEPTTAHSTNCRRIWQGDDMKTNAIRSLRRKLAADQETFGLWVTLESPSITEMAVALGLDWVVIDAEHGHL